MMINYETVLFSLNADAIKDLDGIRQLNDSITLSSDAEVGDNVYSMKANINFRRRKRTAEIDDIELLTNSTHFEFLYGEY